MRLCPFLLLCMLAGCARPPAPTAVVPQPFPALLREGDILFQKLPCGSLCEAIVETTPCTEAFAFNHCGIVRFESAQPVVVEAIGTRVQQTPLSVFLQRDTAARLSVGRVAVRSIADAAAQKSAGYIGRPYDDVFLPGDSALYCSELVWEAFQHGGRPLFSLQPMTFRSVGKTHPGWVEYYRKLGAPIPEGEPGINPCGIAGSEALTMMAILKTELLRTVPTP